MAMSLSDLLKERFGRSSNNSAVELRGANITTAILKLLGEHVTGPEVVLEFEVVDPKILPDVTELVYQPEIASKYDISPLDSTVFVASQRAL